MKELQFDLRENILYKTMMDIKKKPELYLGEKSLKALDVFLHGWYGGVYSCRENMDDDNTSWIVEFHQYVCEVCVGENSCYGHIDAIFEKKYNDEEGFDYYYSLLEKYVQDYAIVNDYDAEMKTTPLKNEIRMIYMNRDFIKEIISDYVSKNDTRLFRLSQGDVMEVKYINKKEDMNGGVIYGISDPGYSDIVMDEMEKYMKTLEGTEKGICYRKITIDEKDA